MSASTTTTTSTTVVLPRATADIEALAADISKLDEAIVVLAEKTKVVKATRTELQKKLRSWMIKEKAPSDIPISVGPGRTATVVEKESRVAITVNVLLDAIIEHFGEVEGQKFIDKVYDGRQTKVVQTMKFVDVVKQAEAKKRRAEAAKLNPKPKRAKKAAAADDDEDEDDDDN